MYLSTPKRYQKNRRQRIINPRSCLIWILAPILIVILIGIYENKQQFVPRINELVDGMVADVGERVDEINAAPPTPTRDPSDDLRRAQLAWDRGSIQEAVNLYRRVIDSVPNDLTVHYQFALGLIMQGEFEEALQAAEDAITANPFSPDAWSIRAMAYNRLGEPEKAIASALRALELASAQAVDENPNLAMSRARAQAFLAEAYWDSEQGDRAFSMANQALETDPQSFEAYQVRGLVNWEYNFDLDSALGDFQEAYSIAPNMIYLGIWLARLEQAYLQNNEAALQIYQDIAEQNPGNTQVLFALGDYYNRVEGNYGEAQGYLNRCVEADPEAAACHYLLGRVQLNLEEAINAQESFTRAIELDPNGNDGQYYYWLGETYITLGRCAQALGPLRQGYQIATQANATSYAEALAGSLQGCGDLSTAPTPEPEITEEPASA